MNPPQTIIAYGGTIPTVTGTVTLFNSATAFPPGGSLHLLGQQWFQFSLRTASAGGTATGTVTGSYSTDKGTTWLPFYSSTTADAVAASAATVAEVFADEVYIGSFKDVRFQYTNAVEVLTVFDVKLSLVAFKNTSKVADSSPLVDLTDPVNITGGAVSSWFRLASSTVTGSGYSSVVDMLNASSPMTQTTDSLRPPTALSANGYPIINTSAHVLSVPLIASRMNTSTWGFWGWIKRGASANNFFSIGTSSGSSALRSYMEIIGGNNLRTEIWNGSSQARFCDAAIGALNTWQFFTVEYDGSGGTDAAKLTRTLGGLPVTVAFSGVAASVGSPLNSATGAGSFCAFTLAGGFPFIGNIGPNFGFLNAKMSGATEGLLTADARAALMNFEAPT
jgi:hypothetical protein